MFILDDDKKCLKQKNYKDALNPWRWAYLNCPQSSGNIYKNGPIIIKAQMKVDKENKAAYIDTLMQIYDIAYLALSYAKKPT